MIKGMKWGGMMFASLLIASSCQNEEVVSNEQQGNYSLKVSSLIDSRTYVKDDGTVVWSQGDKLYVYGNNVSGVLTLTEGADNSTGTFSGFVFGNPDNLKWAVFGDNVKGTTNGAQFTISEITDPNSNSPMVGEIKNGNVDLEHLCGMVRITINNLPENADVKLTGDDIAGTAEWNGTSMSVKSASDEITINVEKGSQTIEVPVFAGETEATKNFKLVVNGEECPFSAPIAIGALSEKAIMHITCITDENGNVTGFTQAATTKESLIQALQTEGTVSFQLSEDIVLDETVVVGANTNATIDLNGKTITGTMHKDVGHVIKNEGTLNLVGGIVKSTGENGGSAIMNTGTMTIEGTTLNGAPDANGSWPSYTINNTGSLTINDATITSVHGAVASYGEGAIVTLNNSTIDMSGIPGFTNHGIYTYNDGKAIVNGGNYENKAADQNSTGGSVINGAVEINGGNFSGRIENYNGNPIIKGGTFIVDPSSYAAEGYTTIQSNGKYHVVEGTSDNVKSVSDMDGLETALKKASEGNVIVLTSNITVSKDWDNRNNGAKTSKLITIDGLGNTLKFTGKVSDAGNYHSAFRFESDAVVKNLTIDMSEVTETGTWLRAISSASNLIVDNCYFIGSDNYTKDNAIVFGDSNSASQLNFEVSITNCEFNNWRRGISDNENAKEIRTLVVDGNTFINAPAYVSVYESVEFTNNVMNNSVMNITSYTSASTAKVKVVGNTLDESKINVIGDSNKRFDSANVECQEGVTVNTL